MTTFDDLLASPGIIVAPGAYDALSARLAVQAGASVVYMTGFGVSGAGFGLPDIGLVSAAEMAERVRVIAASAAPVPLIADGDNGHGGPLNAARLTRAYEQAGAACIQIEDQVFPKRCGHMEGKEVIALEEAAAKIRAAAEARTSAAFKIMARTDARATHDLDEALRRGEAFLRAGADILFIEAPRDEAEMRKVADTFKGVPLVANIVEDGKTPYLGAKALEELGFKIALFPVSALLAVTERLQVVYDTLMKGEGLSASEPRVTFQRYNELIGLGDMLADAAAISEKTER
ncbi:isocitrate lyase/PEP mutase family protein [Parvibaculum sp.]|jgi:2-methylisocitrate lyase-like PEP mutase family enzyme|uniref:isocitrate lyase/PEP mutase family protein n=1 Tax=Parvibaculum sp. TaxID=2024848 RepID=UPI003C78860E